ncbi:MAG: alanine--tRNA ligase, partial [Mycoplasmataceae bacterium]|nr:alanine--tRNA ligase [Mycoplasmataceae bacterium]
MKYLTSNEIRSLWLEFFKSKKHYILPSASLIPINDKSLLWINSGVATLKSYFDGSEQPPSPRLVNSQKAIRTGDIENVGITTRHHTFFEMLGNFSIGDYFKTEAIEFAWELLTSKKWFGIDKNLLYVTVFSEDKEAIEKWIEIGVPKDKIFKMGKNTNFWDMGKGPCGPSSEIFFDKGSEYDSRTAKELIRSDLENDRYIEIWNIVFSQFNNDGKGKYKKLPQQNIDTGAGLERITSVIQNKPSNFETDLFKEIILKIEEKSKFKYLYEYIPSKLIKEDKNQFYINSWFKKIADYIRSVSFAISDGALPEATGRGYIIRMLLRKSVINRTKLGIDYNFLHELVDPLIKIMGKFYPLLIKRRDIIVKTIKSEEEQFNKTLSSVVKKMNNEIESGTLNEESSYKLHETYGLPLEFIKDLSLNNKKVNLDWDKLKKIDEKFKNKSKSNNLENAMNIQDEIFIGLGETEFIGYEKFENEAIVIFVNKNKVVFNKTPFYATSGGQESDFGKANHYNVKYVNKNSEKTFIHLIPGHNFNIGDKVKLSIDLKRREGLNKHHSATHLLFSAIEKITGVSVSQQGSKVEYNFLRFDFSFQEKIDNDLLEKIQNLTNEWIKDSTLVKTEIIPIEKAKVMGAVFLEGAKYEKIVRVVIMNNNCIDMCGGTHVSNTSNIDEVIITKLEKRGSGIWRIEAVAGKENIKKEIIKINKKTMEDFIIPQLNKVKILNSKLLELNSLDILDFKNMIDSLDI